MNKFFSNISTFATIFVVLIVGVVITSAADRAYLGDADGNGKVNAADARIILRHSSSLAKISDDYMHLADINGDTKISAADARIALRMSASLEDLFELGEAYHLHVYETVEIKVATCTEEGSIHDVCKICSKTKNEFVVEKISHEFFLIEKKQSTCIEAGEEIFKCKNCDYTYSVTFDAIGHSFINNTCYSVGYCSICKIKDESTTPTGHKIDPNTFQCSVCNSHLKSPISFISASTKSEINKLGYLGKIGDPDTFKLTKVFYCVGPFQGEPKIAYFIRMEYEYRSPRNVYKTGVKDIYIYESANVLYSAAYGYGSSVDIQWLHKTKYYVNVDEIDL
ncbi:MAG: dockerin type I repeat-containing protein [Clostridia bacterium]|nr:dockerin type I repeat-containing protein [Clostridia bacterium]